MLGTIISIITDTHVLSAAAGATSMWATSRFSTLMGWFAVAEAKLPATVAQLKAAEAAAAPVVNTTYVAASGLVADLEKAILHWKGDIVAGVKKI